MLRVPKLVGQFRPETTWTRRKCAVKCDLCEVEPREESGQNYVKINREKNLAKIMSKLTERRIWPKLCQTTNCWYFLVNYIIVWPTCIKLYLDCLWANLSGWIMRLIKIQYPFLEKIPLCRERKSCGIEHTEFIEVVNLFISSFICNLEFIS